MIYDPRKEINDFGDIHHCLDYLESNEVIMTKDRWLPDQHLSHCAEVINFSLYGYPQQNPVIMQNTIGKMVFHYFTWQNHMHHDTNASTPGSPPYKPVEIAESISRLRAALNAFDAYEGPLSRHYFYGRLTKKQYAHIHCLHFANHWEAFFI